MKKYLILLTLPVFLYTSCKSKLDPNPVNIITDKNIISLLKTKPDVVLGGMSEGIEEFICKAGAGGIEYGDVPLFNLALGVKGNDMVQAGVAAGWFQKDYLLETDAFRYDNSEGGANFWTVFYQHIYKGNQVLDLINSIDLNDIGDPVVLNKLKMYKATALTIRAYGYTYLMWLYQDDYLLKNGKNKAGVPLYLGVGAPQDRAPAAKVWDQIITDASEAVALFNEVKKSPTLKKNDFDATVANMVLARAALTMGQWKVAADAAQVVIDAYPLMSQSDYLDKRFGDISVSEVVLGYDYTQITSGNRSWMSWMSIIGNTGYGGSQGGWWAIDKRLYDQIADADYRKKCWNKEPTQWTYEGAAEPVTHPKYASYKHAAPAKGSNVNYKQDVIFMRSSEAILIKAEAEARSEIESGIKIGDAKATINKLVYARTNGMFNIDDYPFQHDASRYDPSRYTGTINELLEKIQLQWRIEMWGEGFEFYNNKRWGISVYRGKDMNDNINGITNHTAFPQTHTYNTNFYTFQLPLTVELNFNKLIKEQNPL